MSGFTEINDLFWDEIKIGDVVKFGDWRMYLETGYDEYALLCLAKIEKGGYNYLPHSVIKYPIIHREKARMCFTFIGIFDTIQEFESSIAYIKELGHEVPQELNEALKGLKGACNMMARQLNAVHFDCLEEK